MSAVIPDDTSAIAEGAITTSGEAASVPNAPAKMPTHPTHDGTRVGASQDARPEV